MSVLRKYIKILPILSRSVQMQNQLNLLIGARTSSTKKNGVMKVTVCGAGGQVGQPLALMLKQSSLIDELAIHDAIPINGLGADLSHIDTKCKVQAYSESDGLVEALDKSQVVVVAACAPKMAKAAFTSMFEPNAFIVKEIVEKFSVVCPQAILAIATNPIASLVPLASEILKTNGAYNEKKVFGVTSLNVVRANTFVAEIQGLKPECVVVPVVGGTADRTIVPLLSYAKPSSDLSNSEIETITNKIQTAHCDILKAKRYDQAVSYSAAFAIARFVISIIKGLNGENNIVECAFVRGKAHPNAKYFASPLLLGKKGVEKDLGIPNDISDFERCQIEHAVPIVMKEIRKGEQFMGLTESVPCDPCSPRPKAGPCPPNWCR